MALEYSARLRAVEHTGLYVLLALVLIWAPIPIGSARGWSLALLEAGTLFLLGAWALRYTYRPFEIPSAVQHARFSLIALVLWSAYPLIQLIPVSATVIGMVGSGAGSLYGDLPADISTDFLYLTLDRDATFAGLIRQCSMVAVFFSVLALVSSAARMKGLLIVIVAVGFLEAIYGLLVYFGRDELGLWNPGHAQVTVSGTYVNQNHFAGLLEIAIPVGLGLLLSVQPRRKGIHGLKSFARTFSTFVLSQRAIILFCILVMMAALILTASRGGIGALAVGITSAVLVAVWKRGIRTREVLLGIVTVALAATAILWLGSGGFSEKLQATGFSSNRGDQREVSYQMIGDNTMFGTGVGTYRWVFPGYKDERFGTYFYDHAHNDFLEILTEQGIVGFSLLALGMTGIFFHMVRAYEQRRDPLMRGTLFASIAGGVAFLAHGLVDFNFHIPANAIYFFALLGLGTVASCLRTGSRSDRFVAR
jgi:O-antigen ligase